MVLGSLLMLALILVVVVGIGIISKSPREDEIIDKLERNMVSVAGDTFKMGCTSEQKDCAPDEKIVHSVKISDFKINKYEVTQEEWRAVMGFDPEELRFKECDQCPVEGVSWNDTQTFLEKLNQKTKGNYRLPTEAEWEYAARGGKKKSGEYLYAGDDTLSKVGWYNENSGYETSPVGNPEFKSNDLGLYDMSGNVFEWCSDYWHDHYSDATQINPIGPEGGEARVARGGSWSHNYAHCRVSNRGGWPSTAKKEIIGFRLAHGL